MNSRGGEGAEVVYALRNSSTLARNILEAIGEEGQVTRRYYQRRLPENPLEDYYFIIRDTNPAQSLLLEYGFIDNPNDQVRLQNDLLDYVEGVVRAVANYSGYTYIPPEGSSTNYYTVKKGDSLWSIANKFGLTVQELRTLNQLNSDVLQIGQVLKIREETVLPPAGATTYVVKPGDSLWNIARDFGVTVQDIKTLNNLTTDLLQIGQVLQIPSLGNPPIMTQSYTVKRGDSLWSIAQAFNTTVNEIRTLNQLNSDVLQIGQILQVPQDIDTEIDDNVVPPTENITYIVQGGDRIFMEN